MRCSSLQALWGSAPPQHEVTAILGLEQPLSIWTGAADGAIALWKLSPQASTDKALWPFALLCGHTAPISHLEVCQPRDHFRFEEQQLAEFHEFDATGGTCGDGAHDSVVSICVEGFMCVWDGQTGHCRRRRRLPPWVGKPVTLASFPGARRFFCISSNGPSSGQEARKLGSPRVAAPFDRTGTKLSPKGILVVVDSLTLSVLQVVYNGSLGIGVMSTMMIVPQEETNMILVSDVHGKLRAWSGVVIDSGREGVWEGAHEDKSEHVSISTDSLTDTFMSERAEAVTISADGMLVLVVFRSRWMLRSVEDGTVIAEKVCIGDSMECSDVTRHQSHSDCYWAGGLFLPDDSSRLDIGLVQRLLVWTSQGAAVLYCSRECDETYNAYCTLPPVEEELRGLLKSSYCCVDNTLVRSDSLWPGSEVGPVVETRITAWPLPGFNTTDPSPDSDGFLVSRGDAETCGFAGLWGDWLNASSSGGLCGTPVIAWEKQRSKEWGVENGWGRPDSAEGDSNSSVHRSLTKCSSSHEAPGSHELLDRNLFVTATMLLSGSSLVPSMLVYGYGSGEIRMVELEAIEPVDSTDDCSPDHMFKQRARYFAGHTAPVFCLAEHNMAHFGRVLISGSMDSSVCVWDLREKGAPLAVLHHHVAPVRQIVLPPPGTQSPWSRCFITVGEDACVAVVSLDTLQVVRMFPGHPFLPKMIAWDHHRGYVAVLCPHPEYGQNNDVLYIWDIHSGARERILRGASAHSMYAHFTARIRAHSASASSTIGGNATSASSLLPAADELTPRGKTGNASMFMSADAAYMDSNESSTDLVEMVAVDADDVDRSGGGLIGSLERLSVKVAHVLKTGAKPEVQVSTGSINYISQGKAAHMLLHIHQPMKGACPMPGVAALQFDLLSLMAPNLEALSVIGKLSSSNQEGMQKVHMMDGLGGETTHNMSEQSPVKGHNRRALNRRNTLFPRADTRGRDDVQAPSWLVSIEGRLLRMSLSFLHLWGVDANVDQLLVADLHVYQPEHIGVGLGLGGDRGAMTLLLPSQVATYELWRTSAEFCSIRSLSLVSLAQRLILVSKPASYACSELAGFYSRGLAEKLPGVSSPCLEVYASFWQDQSEHVRMAARTLFHCAAPRAAPAVLRADDPTSPGGGGNGKGGLCDQSGSLSRWLESSEGQYWTLMVGGTEQDGKAARIIVAASLAAWYPTIVRPDLAAVVAPLLLQMVRAAKDKHVASVAEILAEGMASTWHNLIANQSRHFMVEVFDQIENLSNIGETAESGTYPAPAVAMAIRESFTGNLLPSLAMADVSGFLHVAHNQLEATASDSAVHRVALSVLIRCIRGAPKAVLPHLGQVTSLILQTLEAANYSLRKQCIQSAMAAVREMVRVFPMIALYPGSSTSNPKLAVGDPVGDVRTVAIHVYDLHSVTMLKVLDASGPPGHPALLSSSGSAGSISGISAVVFSNDGEGLVAFSQNGLVIRWWSLGAVWWERLSRSHVPVQCTKLVLVPPWAGFSPRSSSSSLMHVAALGHRSNRQGKDDSGSDQETPVGHERRPSDDSALKLAYLGLDLSYRLEWQADKLVVLLHHGQELGSFQL